MIASRIPFKKITALLTCIVFIYSSIIAPNVHAALDNSAIKQTQGKVFEIPASMGKITAARYYGSKEAVINIQDLHCHPEVQRNIAGIIGYLEKEYGIKKVYLEGAADKVDTRWLSNAVKNEAGRGIIDSMLDSGYLSGSEYYSIINKKSDFVTGIEDSGIYRRNIKLLADIINSGKEVKAICESMKEDIYEVKKEYTSKKFRKFDRVVRRFKNNKVDVNTYYGFLIKTAKEEGIDLSGYGAIQDYYKFYSYGNKFNSQKAAKELGIFIGALKNIVSYGEYSALSSNSEGFSNIEDITKDLSEIDNKYNICASKKLKNCKTLLDYMAFNGDLNPLVLANQEKSLKEEICDKLGQNKYEREVIFLSEFIPKIENYFTANITSEDLSGFSENFKKFRQTWCSYFSENTAKKLDKYAEILNEYHANNIKRDKIFAKKIIGSGAGEALYSTSGKSALQAINEQSSKIEFKVAVTGGFHSSGLSDICKEKKVTYIVITPRVSGDIEKAHDVYINTIRSYAAIGKNAVNIAPVTDEGFVLGFPKVLAGGFLALKTVPELKKLKEQDKEAALRQFVSDIIEKYEKTDGIKDVSWEFSALNKKTTILTVKYITESGKESTNNYTIKDNKLVFYDKSGEKQVETLDIKQAWFILNGFFKDTKSTVYKICTVFIAPIFEEFVFKALPFAAAVFFTGNPASFLPIAITSVCGIALFPLAHMLADNIAQHTNPDVRIRNIKDMFAPQIVITGLFIGITVLSSFFMPFYAAVTTGLIFPVIAHSIKSFKALPGKARDGKTIKNKTRKLLESSVYSGFDRMVREIESMDKSFLLHIMLDEEIYVQYKQIFNELKKAKDYEIEKRTDIVSEKLTEFSSLFIKYGKDDNYVRNRMMIHIMNITSFAARYIPLNENTTLLERDFDFVIENSNDFLGDQEQELLHVAADIYAVDKKLAMSMVQRIGKTSKREIFSKKGKEFKDISDVYNFLPEKWQEIAISNEELKMFMESFGLIFDIDWNDDSYRRYKNVADYVKILDKLPDEILFQTNIPAQKQRYFAIKKDNNLQYEALFDSYVELLENNASALAEMNGFGDSSIKDAIFFLGKMISNFKTINPEYANDAENALNAIKKQYAAKGASANFIKEQKTLKHWHEDKMADIKEVHTLINAVHQTAILKFTQALKKGLYDEEYKRFDDNPSREVSEVYDLSKGKIQPEIIDFLSRIPDIKYDRFVLKDDKIIWNRQIGVHSVDIFIDFTNIEEGIRISYNDQSRSKGNILRVMMLAAKSKQLGMYPTRVDVRPLSEADGVCGFQAVYSVENKIDMGKKYAEVISAFTNVLSRTVDLNLDLGKFQDANEKPIPAMNLDDFRNLQDKLGTMPREFKGTHIESFWDSICETSHSVKEDLGNLVPAYEYLGISEKERNIAEIKRMFVEGRIIVNASGNIERNYDFKPMENIAQSIMSDKKETFRQAQLINLIDYDELSLKTEGYIGNMVALHGLMRLENGYLSISGAADSKSKRLRCVNCEFVDFDGNRKALRYKELSSILTDKGIIVKKQEERSKNEIKDIMKDLLSDMPRFDGVGQIAGMGASKGAGGFTAGKAVYKKEDVAKNDNSVWVVRYTTPEDVENIEKSKAMLTTNGGILSHANITAREKNIPAVLFKTRWVNDKIELSSYEKFGPGEMQSGFLTQKVRENKTVLNEGDTVLINGESGHILLFQNTDRRLLAKLQKCIDENSTEEVVKILEDSRYDASEAVEYVYYQIVGKKKYAKMLDMMFEINGDGRIKKKLIELNDIYVNGSLEIIDEIISNISGIKDTNVKYALILKATAGISKLTHNDSENKFMNALVKVGKLRKKLSKKMNMEVEIFESRLTKLLNKDSFSGEDIDLAVQLIEKAKVWKSFYGSRDLNILIRQLDRKIAKDARKQKRAANIESLQDIAASDKFRYGGKTTELAKIIKVFEKNKMKGVAIPAAFGLDTNVLENSLSGTKYNEYYDKFSKYIQTGDIDSALKIARTIRELIIASNDEDLKNKITGMLDGTKSYAVRSSGVGEDGAEYAFAGMGETKLYVSEDQIYESIKSSWVSFFDPGSVRYMASSRHVVKPAILIQEMVEDINKAGVIFTKDDVGNLTIEGVWGLGEGLVSGRVSPDHIKINSKTGKIKYFRAAENRTKIVKAKSGGTELVRLPRLEKIGRVLKNANIKKLKKVSAILEAGVGYPVDIEFAIDNKGKIFILQRRPITTFIDSSVAINDSDTAAIDSSMKSNLSILDGLLKGKNKALYKLYTVVIAPFLEEFIFKAIPFFVSSVFIAGSFSLLPIAVTAVFSIALFPLAHKLADNIAKNIDPEVRIRNIKNMYAPQIVITGLFMGVSILASFFMPFYAAVTAGLILPVIIHSVHNLRIFLNKTSGMAWSILGGNENVLENNTDENERVVSGYKKLLRIPEANNNIRFEIEENAEYDAKKEKRFYDCYYEIEKYNERALYAMTENDIDALFENLNGMLISFVNMLIIKDNRLNDGKMFEMNGNKNGLKNLFETMTKLNKAIDKPGLFYNSEKYMIYVFEEVIKKYLKNPDNKDLITRLNSFVAEQYWHIDMYQGDFNYYMNRNEVGLHTLINIIHQHASSTFTHKADVARTINVYKDDNFMFQIKDTSPQLPDKIKEFVYEIADLNFTLKKGYSSRRIMVNDNVFRFHYSVEHSIDINVNLGKNHGIEVYYGDLTEGGSRVGMLQERLNKIGYLPKITERGGDGGALNFKYSADESFNLQRQYAERFKKLLDVLPMPDIDMKKIKNRYQSEIAHVKKSLEIDDKNITAENLIRMIINGEIVRTDDGFEWAENSSMVIIDNMIENLSKAESPKEDIFRNAQLLNLVEYSGLNFKPHAMFGRMIGLSGIMEVNGGYLSVNASSISGKEKGLRCAIVYFVDYGGNRKKLNCGELLEIFKKQREINPKQTLPNLRNKDEITAIIQMHKEKPAGYSKQVNEIQGKGLLAGYSGYVSGQISYNINENNKKGKIVITGEMSPDDAAKARGFNAVLSTGKAERSHAVLDLIEKTASSDAVPVILLNGKYKGKKLEVVQYKTGKQIETNGFPVYEMSAEYNYIEQGDNVLINPVSGSILLFKDIDTKILDLFVAAIESKDADKIETIIKNNKDIERQLCEYMFYYTVSKGKYKQTLSKLTQRNTILKEHVETVSKDFYRHQIGLLQKKLNDLQLSIKNITDAKIRFNLILILEKQIETLNKEYSIKELLSQISELKSVAQFELEEYVSLFNSRAEKAVKDAGANSNNEEALSTALKLIDEAAVWNNFWNHPGTVNSIEKLNNILNAEINKKFEYPAQLKQISDFKPWDAQKYGSKAVEIANLARMAESNKNIGVPVVGFGIPYEILESYLGGNAEKYQRLYAELTKILMGKTTAANSNKAKKISSDIKKLIEESFIYDERIESFLDKTKNYYVRSSAVGEDGAKYSFAGIAESKGNVKPDKEQMSKAIISVWTSFFSDTSVNYMFRNKVAVRPAVFVQEMINAEKSGVLFTRDNEGNIIIEADWGIEGVTRGSDADHIIVAYNPKNDNVKILEYRRVGRGGDDKKLVADNEKGGIVEQEIPANELNNRVLPDANIIRQLVSFAIQAENEKGYALDMEFAIQKGKKKIDYLQARPETIFVVEDDKVWKDSGSLDKAREKSVNSILDSLFKDKNSSRYKFYTVVIAPLFEEFVFRVIPLMSTYLFSFTQISFIPILITAVSGMLLFPMAHTLADKQALKNNKSVKVRNFKSIFGGAAKLTGIFLTMPVLSVLMTAFFALPPLAPLTLISLSYILSVLMHGLHNYSILSGAEKGDILSVFDFDSDEVRKKSEKLVSDNIGNLISALENIKGKKYNEFLGEWAFEGKQLDDLSSIIEALTNAQRLGDSEKLKVVEEQLHLLIDLVNTFKDYDKYGHMNRNRARFELLLSFAELGTFVRYNDSDESIFEKAFFMTLNNTEYAGYIQDVLVPLVRRVFWIDKEIGKRFIRVFYEDGYNKNSLDGIILKKVYPKDMQDAREKNPYTMWGGLFNTDEEIMMFFNEIMGVDIGNTYSDFKHQNPLRQISEFLPEEISGRLPVSEEFSFKIKKRNKFGEGGKISEKFDSYINILKNNKLAIASLGSSNEKGVFNTIGYIENMINGLELINSYAADELQKALNAIKVQLAENSSRDMIEKQKELDENWIKHPISEIRQLHTLINAIHQTAKENFMSINSRFDKEKEQIAVQRDSSKVTVYDFSDKPISRNAADFLSKLTEFNQHGTISFLAKNGIFVWDMSIGAHSVDVLINFSDLSEGLTLNYVESASKPGNAKRAVGFAEDVAYAGFDVKFNDSGVYSFQASFVPSSDDMLNVGEKYAEMLIKIDGIFSGTKDWDLGYNGDVFPTITDMELQELKGSVRRYSLFDRYGLEENNAKFEKIAMISGMDELYKSLGISDIKTTGEIIRRFASGRLVVRNGSLTINHDYNPAGEIIDAVSRNADEAFLAGEIINAVNFNSFVFRKEGYIGSMLMLDGVLRLEDGSGYLSVKALMDPETKRIECAYVDHVNFKGEREKVNSNKLKKLLVKSNGCNIKNVNGRNVREIKDVIAEMEKDMRFSDKGIELNGMHISSGDGKVASLEITYNKENLDEGKVYVVKGASGISTRDIKKAGGLIVAGNGNLSHPCIVAKDLNKKAILFPYFKWEKSGLVLHYQVPAGAKESVKGFYLQKTEEKAIELPEGSRILFDADAGNIHVFDLVDNAVLKKIDDAIESKNKAQIQSAIENSSGNVLGQIIEYIYLKCAGNAENTELLKILFSFENSEEAGAKVEEIKTDYIDKNIKQVAALLLNAKNMNNNKKAFTLIIKAERILNNIDEIAPDNRIRTIKNIFNELKFEKMALFVNDAKDFKKKALKFIRDGINAKEDADSAMKISESAKYWQYYYGYEGVEEIVKELDFAILAWTNQQSRIAKLKDLEKLSKVDVYGSGSKASELGYINKLLKKKGFKNVKVPYVISILDDMLDNFLAGTNYAGLISVLRETIKRPETKENSLLIKKTLNEIVQLIDNVDDRDIKNEIDEVLLDYIRYAFRSSGIGEDGIFYSFAGRAESLLGVKSGDSASALKTIWKSFFTEEAAEYMQTSGTHVTPGIFIQEMVEDAEAAGIISTANKDGNIEINVVFGLGQELAAGNQQPDNIMKRTGDGIMKYRKADERTVKIVMDKSGGVASVLVGDDEADIRVLNDKTARKLINVANFLEKDADHPVEIEFAIKKDGSINILQRRAIAFADKNYKITDDNPAKNTKISFMVRKDVPAGKPITHIAVGEESIPVYFEKVSKRGVIVLSTASNNAAAIKSIAFVTSLYERLNTDRVALNSLNSNLPVTAQKVAAGSIEFVPIQYDAGNFAEIHSGTSLSKDTNSILAAA